MAKKTQGMADARGRYVELGLVLALAGWLASCATPTSPALEHASSVYASAASDPEIARTAPVPLHQAQQKLDRAAQVLAEDDDQEQVEHLAYLAERDVEIARALTRQRRAEAEIQQLARERGQVLLQAREREVDVARIEAQQARNRAQKAAHRAQEATERAETLQAEIRDLQGRETDRGIVLTLGDVLFDFDEATLRRGAEKNLSRLVQFLDEHRDREVLIEGHTDAVGSDRYNRDLSLQRAEAVRSFLIQHQIAPGRIAASGLGETHPIASNDSPAGRQVNRRVEVVILDPGQSAAALMRAPAPVGSGRGGSQ